MSDNDHTGSHLLGKSELPAGARGAVGEGVEESSEEAGAGLLADDQPSAHGPVLDRSQRARGSNVRGETSTRLPASGPRRHGEKHVARDAAPRNSCRIRLRAPRYHRQYAANPVRPGVQTGHGHQVRKVLPITEIHHEDTKARRNPWRFFASSCLWG